MNARIPFCYGAALTMLGAWSWLGTGATGILAMVPLGFGVVLQLLALAGERPRLRLPVLYGVLLLAAVGLSGSADAVPGFVRAVFDRAVMPTVATIVPAGLALFSAALAFTAVRTIHNERRAQRTQAAQHTPRRMQ